MEKEKQKKARRDFRALEARRMRAASLFRQGKSPSEAARFLGVSRDAASRWCRLWKREGKKSLKAAGRAGRKPKLDTEQLSKLAKVLLRGSQAFGWTNNLWTLERIAKVIFKLYRVHYHPRHVWRIMGRLGWSCQRPERRAKQRNEDAIRRWIKERWPLFKKKQKDWVLI